MTDSVIRIGANRATKLRSGGWACSRPGDVIPTWQHDEQDAARLLRSWLPTTDVPPAAGSDGLDGIAPRTSSSLAPGSASPMYGADPGAPKTLIGVEVGASLGGGAPTGANTDLFSSGARS